jgi:hypothetical protein
MKNRTKMTIPAMYVAMIAEIYADTDGYWLHTAPGFYSDEMECGTIHEQTQARFKAMLSSLVACGSTGGAGITQRDPGWCYCGHACLPKPTRAPATSYCVHGSPRISDGSTGCAKCSGLRYY